MEVKELARQFKSSYKIEESSYVSGNTRTTTRKLVFTGNNLPLSIKSDYERMLREMQYEASRSNDPLEIYKRFGFNYEEQLFIMILLDKGLLKEKDVELFRKRVFNLLKLPGKIVGFILFIAFVIFIIVISTQ